METRKPPSKQHGAPHDFQTPDYALRPLLPYLKPKWTIWECASGKGYLADALEHCGFPVIRSDILDGKDFFTWRPEHFDCIVTNPPYDLCSTGSGHKAEWIERTYLLGKPFALLLKLEHLSTWGRLKWFMSGLQIILFAGRIHFETPSGVGSGSWFEAAWFTNGLGLPSDIVFPHSTIDRRPIVRRI